MLELKYTKYLFNQDVSHFLVRVLIVGVVFSVSLYIPIRQISYDIDKLQNQTSTKVNHIYLKGIISNPAALLEASYRNEYNNKLDSSILDMRLAIELLELGCAQNDKVIFYKKRLADLERKQLSLK